jgi:hypothetical protein
MLLSLMQPQEQLTQLEAILTQKDEFDNFFAISYAFRQLKDLTLSYLWI